MAAKIKADPGPRFAAEKASEVPSIQTFAPWPRTAPSVNDYVHGIRCGDTSILARAITLVESNAPAHQGLAEELLLRLLPFTGGAMRLGITGIPGAGKSTFIEALGEYLCEKGHKVAVLAVDPSSTVSGGSILGDKLRMEKLSREPNAFIRPSPSSGSLGGVARKTREALLLCEAAGYDVVLVETVGVGQSEVTVRSMVDCFVLLTVAGTGDEIQGLKKGTVELADVVVVNKADGENRLQAEAARAELSRVLHYLRPATEGWTTPALLASARTGKGVAEIWEVAEAFFAAVRNHGALELRRREQAVAWMHSMVRETLLQEFYLSAGVRAQQPEIDLAVAEGRLLPPAGARRLLDLARER